MSHDLQFAVDLARSAGKIVLEHYGAVERLTKTHAATTDEAVTEADRATQRHIVAAIQKRFPNDGIVGEEDDTGSGITARLPDPRGRVWVIDPIDGTNNFIAGLGAFAVCIGLIEDGMPTLGVVYDVTRDLPYAAAKGQGAWAGNRRLHAKPNPLSSASVIMLTSNLIDAQGRCPSWATKWLGQTDYKLRIMGSAALEAVQVAAGVAHASITVNGKLWDCAAPAAIVIEAGGIVSDLKGQPVYPFDLRNYAGAKVPFIAAGPAAHGELVKYVVANP
jgi:myo-inositol-1(or 4)-monophosphatase